MGSQPTVSKQGFPTCGTGTTSDTRKCDEKSFLKHNIPQHRKDRNLSRKCTTSLIGGQNHNGEVADRSWLCFSPSQTFVKCFTCRLMCTDTTKCAHFLIRKGIFDWKHALEPLRSREHSMEHIDATIISLCSTAVKLWKTTLFEQQLSKDFYNCYPVGWLCNIY